MIAWLDFEFFRQPQDLVWPAVNLLVVTLVKDPHSHSHNQDARLHLSLSNFEITFRRPNDFPANGLLLTFVPFSIFNCTNDVMIRYIQVLVLKDVLYISIIIY